MEFFDFLYLSEVYESLGLLRAGVLRANGYAD